MPRYAVSHISFFDNELTTVIVEAENLVDAYQQSDKVLESLPQTIFVAAPDESEKEHVERIKVKAFNCDAMVHAELIPDPAPTQPDIPPYPRNTLL